MTMQKLFNKAINGLIKQGRRSMGERLNNEPSCAYTSTDADGNERYCAVGLLMTTDERLDALERGANFSGIDCLKDKVPEFFDRVDPDGSIPRHFFIGLQQCHDEAPEGDEFEWFVRRNAEGVADEWELSMRWIK